MRYLGLNVTRSVCGFADYLIRPGNNIKMSFFSLQRDGDLQAQLATMLSGGADYVFYTAEGVSAEASIRLACLKVGISCDKIALEDMRKFTTGKVNGSQREMAMQAVSWGYKVAPSDPALQAICAVRCGLEMEANA